MKSFVVVAGLLTAFMFAASSSSAHALSDPTVAAAVSPGGRCLLEGSSCERTAECCSLSCENGTCVTRDP